MKNNAAIVTFNAGSSSLKFGLYVDNSEGLSCITQGGILDLDSQPVFEISQKNKSQNQSRQNLPQVTSHAQAITWLFNWLQQNFSDIHIAAAGHRVVHGGNNFTQAVKVNRQVLQQLHELTHLAPLHMPHNLAVIEALQKQQAALPQVACFDTAFHHTMSWNEQHYALPREWFDKGIRRYGFHGLSYEYIASVLPEHLGEQADAKVIVAHLGHGASLCAMHGRQSVATTMGFTPLGGIPMATRPGDIDPGLNSWLIHETELSIDEIDDLLNHQSGLLALSGISGDMRVLLANNSEAAQQAIDYFAHHTHRAIASLTAVLGGLDALIFTAGIGENSAAVRHKICARAGWLGLELDDASNASDSTDKSIKISTDNSRVSIWRIPTNEEIIIARHTRTLLTEIEHGEMR